MNRTVMMIMGGALVVAILVALIVQSRLSPKREDAQAAVVTEVLVTNKKLEAGVELKQEDTAWQAWPEKAIYTGVIRKAEGETPDVFGKPLRRALELGEPVTQQSVVETAKGSAGVLATTLAPGMRAVALSVSAETMAGGFISPGDHVDIILSYQVKIEGEARENASSMIQRLASQTVLRNVRVLAIDQNAKEGTRDAKVGKTVTMEVDREGAEVLALASSMGELRLALRRLGEDDSESARTPLVTDVHVSDVLKKVLEIQKRAPTNAGNVRVYNGVNVQNVPVRGEAVTE